MDSQTSIMYMLPLLTSFNNILNNSESSWNRIFMIVMMFIPFLMNVNQLYFNIRNCVREFIEEWMPDRLQFTARQQIRRWYDEPDSVIRNFATVMWDWNSRNEINGVLHLSEEANAPPLRYYEEDPDSSVKGELNGAPLFIDNKNTWFSKKDTPDIEYRMWIERTVERDGTNTSEIVLNIRFGKRYTNSDMVEHINYIRKESKQIREKVLKKQKVLVSVEASNDEPLFMTYEFHTTSSFANFFCEEARIVENDLIHFIKEKSEYERIGRPWTYTVLNSGPPGVGKTKLVKSLAKHTGYTVIVLNLHHMKDLKMLYSAFHNTVLAGEKIAHEKRLYYIPEVDTQLQELLSDRSTQKSKKENNTVVLDSIGNNTTSTVMNLTSSSKKPTLGEILNILDGIPERHGQILVIDTNFIDSLDKALIRPGRVDRILNWKYLSSDSTRKYLENYYNTKIPTDTILPNEIITAAELGSLVADTPTIDLVCTKINSLFLPKQRPKRNKN